MQDIIKRFDKRNSEIKIFKDFLEIGAIAISNTVDVVHFKEREDRYKEIIKSYSKGELDLFAEMLASLVIELEKGEIDVLGDLMMRMGFGADSLGQYFTPNHISSLVAKLSITPDLTEKQIKEHGTIRLTEPSVGGGSLVLAGINKLKELGYNYQQVLEVVCGDIDISAVHMTYIQLSLLGVKAKVQHTNALSFEIWSDWYTPACILDGGLI